MSTLATFIQHGIASPSYGNRSFHHQVALVVKNPPANAGNAREVDMIPRQGRSPGVGNGNPLQYSCLEHPMDRRPWQATVHGVAMSRMRLSARARAHTHTHTNTHTQIQQSDKEKT